MAKIIINSNGISGSADIVFNRPLASIPANVAYVSEDTVLTTANNVVLANASNREITITLPAIASSSYNQFIIKKIDSTENYVFISGSNSETIDGNSAISLPYRISDSVILINDGNSNWFIL